jgi:hypothetical protein
VNRWRITTFHGIAPPEGFSFAGMRKRKLRFNVDTKHMDKELSGPQLRFNAFDQEGKDAWLLALDSDETIAKGEDEEADADEEAADEEAADEDEAAAEEAAAAAAAAAVEVAAAEEAAAQKAAAAAAEEAANAAAADGEPVAASELERHLDEPESESKEDPEGKERVSFKGMKKSAPASDAAPAVDPQHEITIGGDRCRFGPLGKAACAKRDGEEKADREAMEEHYGPQNYCPTCLSVATGNDRVVSPTDLPLALCGKCETAKKCFQMSFAFVQQYGEKMESKLGKDGKTKTYSFSSKGKRHSTKGSSTKPNEDYCNVCFEKGGQVVLRAWSCEAAAFDLCEKCHAGNRYRDTKAWAAAETRMKRLLDEKKGRLNVIADDSRYMKALVDDRKKVQGKADDDETTATATTAKKQFMLTNFISNTKSNVDLTRTEADTAGGGAPDLDDDAGVSAFTITPVLQQDGKSTGYAPQFPNHTPSTNLRHACRHFDVEFENPEKGHDYKDGPILLRAGFLFQKKQYTNGRMPFFEVSVLDLEPSAGFAVEKPPDAAVSDVERAKQASTGQAERASVRIGVAEPDEGYSELYNLHNPDKMSNLDPVTVKSDKGEIVTKTQFLYSSTANITPFGKPLKEMSDRQYQSSAMFAEPCEPVPELKQFSSKAKSVDQQSGKKHTWSPVEYKEGDVIGCGVAWHPRIEVMFTKGKDEINLAKGTDETKRHYVGSGYAVSKMDAIKEVYPVIGLHNVARAKLRITFRERPDLKITMHNWRTEGGTQKAEPKRFVQIRAGGKDSVDGRRIGDIPFMSAAKGVMDYIHKEAKEQPDQEQKDRPPIQAVFEDLLKTQVAIINLGLNVGDEVFLMPKRSRAAKSSSFQISGKKKSNDVWVVCRVPPPGGHGAMVEDVAGGSMLLKLLRYDGDSKGSVVDVQEDVYENVEDFTRVSKVPGMDSEAAELETTVLPPTVPTQVFSLLENAVRFSHNPVSAALAASHACAAMAEDTKAVSKGQQEQLAERAETFADLAYRLVEFVEGPQLTSALLPTSGTNLLPNEKDETGCAVELAIASYNTRFVAHPRVAEMVDEIWLGDTKKSIAALKWPVVSDMFTWPNEKGGFIQQMVENVTTLCDVDFILAPVVRFATGFSFLVVLIALQHLVVFNADIDVGSIGSTEWVFIVVSVGFVLGEMEEAAAAMAENQMGKYLADIWNWVDWMMHTVFVCYIAMRLEACYGSFTGDADEIAVGTWTTYSLRCLSLNCILIWMRLMNVMTVSSAFGPLIRMMSLMVGHVLRFFVILFMFVIGFAGTFHVWFKHVDDDGAADNFDLQSTIIDSLGAGFTDHPIAAPPNEGLDSAGFDTLFKAMLTLFSGAMGDFSFDAIRKDQPIFGPFIMMLYIFVGSIMLLNLLIAILGDVYGDVQAGAQEEFRFGKTKTVTDYRIFWNKYGTHVSLPAPMNLITAPLIPVLWLVEACTKTNLNVDRIYSLVNVAVLITLLSGLLGTCVWLISVLIYAAMVPIALLFGPLAVAQQFSVSTWDSVENHLPHWSLTFLVTLILTVGIGLPFGVLLVVVMAAGGLVCVGVYIPVCIIFASTKSYIEVTDEHHLDVAYMFKNYKADKARQKLEETKKASKGKLVHSASSANLGKLQISWPASDTLKAKAALLSQGGKAKVEGELPVAEGQAPVPRRLCATSGMWWSRLIEWTSARCIGEGRDPLGAQAKLSWLEKAHFDEKNESKQSLLTKNGLVYKIDMGDKISTNPNLKKQIEQSLKLESRALKTTDQLVEVEMGDITEGELFVKGSGESWKKMTCMINTKNDKEGTLTATPISSSKTSSFSFRHSAGSDVAANYKIIKGYDCSCLHAMWSVLGRWFAVVLVRHASD